ncbi:hypothetical protein QAD02_022438 [Eretmocerus hayati]|uniref:Uncharacterized protein n=1 Tax=Eretmocerus hayati TaxID=131215 RepID=A0ACC2PVI5_9HYME|nr:hypothetical protein QAD02_022438 [Eretmocerus hayati]
MVNLDSTKYVDLPSQTKQSNVSSSGVTAEGTEKSSPNQPATIAKKRSRTPLSYDIEEFEAQGQAGLQILVWENRYASKTSDKQTYFNLAGNSQSTNEEEILPGSKDIQNYENLRYQPVVELTRLALPKISRNQPEQSIQDTSPKQYQKRGQHYTTLIDEGPRSHEDIANEALTQEYQEIDTTTVGPPENREERQARNLEQIANPESYEGGVTIRELLDEKQENIQETNAGEPIKGAVTSREQRTGLENMSSTLKILKEVVVNEEIKSLGIIRDLAILNKSEWGYFVEQCNRIFRKHQIYILPSSKTTYQYHLQKIECE